jgi:hypothetical protein
VHSKSLRSLSIRFSKNSRGLEPDFVIIVGIGF